MPQATTAIPTATFSEVLANLAFLFTGEEPTDPPSASRWWEASIAYRGPYGGTLRLRCTPEFAALLAANLLGTDPQAAPAGARAADSVKELMNVFCGHFVTTVYGTKHVFDVSLPEIRELPAEDAADAASEGDFATVYVEGHIVRIVHEPGLAEGVT